MGSLTFHRVQYGKEATYGTAVAATRRWLGTCSIPKDREAKLPAYTLAQKARANAVQIGQYLADPVNTVVEDGYFQALPLIFGCGLKGDVVATETTGGQADYAWDFTPSLTAANSPDSATIEAGDDSQAFEMEYAMVKRINIDGTIGDDSKVSVSAEWFARQVSKASFTAALSYVTPEPMFGNKTELWIDSTWATLGTTKKSALLRDYGIEILTGNHPKFMADGQFYFQSHGESYIDVTANFTLEGGADAVQIFDDYRAGTKRAIRLKISGSQIGTGVNHSLTLDVYGAFTEVIPLSGDAEGNTLYTCIFSGLSDMQATPHMLGVNVVTDINAY